MKPESLSSSLHSWREAIRDELDAADVERVLDGDVEAYEGIVRRWQGPLLTLAYRFCRDSGRAEDMAQTAFLKAFRALGQWRREGVFGAWLIAVATNVYRSEMGRPGLLTVPLDSARDVPDGLTFDPSSDEDEDRNEVIRRAVLALPAHYRDAIVLYYFHQMGVGEAARSLSVAEGTVKARLHRGRALLKKVLRRRLSDEDFGSGECNG